MLYNNLQKTLTLLVFVASIFLCNFSNAETGRYRAMFGNDPSTEMTIGFDAYFTGTNPVLYYSTNPININNLSSYSSQKPATPVVYHNMVNSFVRLTNLLPGRTYYFVVKDNSGVSEVYNFETIANNNDTKLSIIAGGDSRNNLKVRATANKIVSKLNAHAFMFDGDFVDQGNSSTQWQVWLDDWQLTINSNNRITPIIPAKGNHENNPEILVSIFDCKPNIIYANTFGHNLLQIYTLNSEMSLSYASTQTNWLENQLVKSNSIWKFAQYHKPIRPHITGKKEGAMQYAYWAQLFYKYGMDAVLESHSHVAKQTWPIVPCSGGFDCDEVDCDEGFKRDDYNGTVYLGEGAYAAPLREVNDNKSWTRDSGTFHQFKWIFVDKYKMEIRTVKYDNIANTSLINELGVANRFTIPRNLEIWNPPNGDVVTLTKPTSNIPTCTLTTPIDNEMYISLDNITLTANATGTAGIARVQFYVNGIFAGTGYNKPYQLDWQPPSNGVYIISAIAHDVNGQSSALDFSVIKIGNKENIEHSSTIDITSNEYREETNGEINSNSYKIEICNAEVALQGLRFRALNIPKNAIIQSAVITFTSGGSFNNLANATIWCEKSGKTLPFRVDNGNITNRLKTFNSVNWDIPNWPNLSVQKTPDLSNTLQELVELEDWSIESPVTFLIKGNNGTRRAKSFASVEGNRDKFVVPKLTVKFSLPDCFNLPCNDDNECDLITNGDFSFGKG